MDVSRFTESKTGQLVQIQTEDGPDFAFTPDPLPPNWEFPVRLWPLLAEAREELARLDEKGRTIPNPTLLLDPLQKWEALRSSSIEGTYATAKELLLFELSPRDPTSRDDKANDWHKSMEDETFARGFTAAMDCRGVLLGPAMARKLDLKRFTRLLDIGGGSGIYACALVANNPQLTATVFDQPSVEKIATKRIAELGMAGRVAVKAGDMLNEPLPADCDLHLYSNVLHDWDVAEVRRLLAASFRALKPGGMLLIHDAFINADKAGPLPVAEYSALLMHSTQGKCYSTGEYETLLTEAGFRGFTFATTAADRGVMTAGKPA